MIFILKIVFKFKTATFQLILSLSFTQNRYYAIFNYDKIDWTSASSKNVFVGYTNGANLRITNRFSNNADSKSNPALIDNNRGNSGNKSNKK